MQINTVGVYWKARRESAQECTIRLIRFFAELASEFPALANWYEKIEDGSTVEPISQLGEKDLLSLVAAGSNRRDIGREPIADLGFNIGLRTQGTGGVDSSLSITCGLFSPNPGLGNAVVVKLPIDLQSVSLDTPTSQKRLLLLLVKTWDAEWGAAYSSRSNVFKQRKSNAPFLDNILWLKNGIAGPENVVECSSSELAAGGVLYMK